MEVLLLVIVIVVILFVAMRYFQSEGGSEQTPRNDERSNPSIDQASPSAPEPKAVDTPTETVSVAQPEALDAPTETVSVAEPEALDAPPQDQTDPSMPEPSVEEQATAQDDAQPADVVSEPTPEPTDFIALARKGYDEEPYTAIFAYIWETNADKQAVMAQFFPHDDYARAIPTLGRLSDEVHRQAIAKLFEPDFRSAAMKVYEAGGTDALTAHLQQTLPAILTLRHINLLVQALTTVGDYTQIDVPKALRGRPLPYRTVRVLTQYSGEQSTGSAYRIHMHEQGIADDGWADLGQRYRLRLLLGIGAMDDAIADVRYLTDSDEATAIDYIKTYIERATQPPTEDDDPAATRKPMVDGPPHNDSL